MLRSEDILFYTELGGLTATPASLTATQTGQTTTRRGLIDAQAGQTATQVGPTARTQRGSSSSVPELERVAEDWRKSIADYLRYPSQKVDKGIWRITFKFTLINDELYRRTAEDLLLKCLDHDQAKITMGEAHESICGTHQSAPKMKWLLRRARFYWPTMIADCFRYRKGCKECKFFANIQTVPTATLHPISKPWPFRGWDMDFIKQIYPSSSKGHRFVLVAIDYFTKWTEAIPLKNMTHKEVIEFITEHIIHRFGIPQTLTTDHGTSFTLGQLREFADSYKINFLNSSPYYAQANDQTKSSNKTLIKLIKKKIEENPRRWHKILSEAL
jgi:hypothetical protein